MLLDDHLHTDTKGYKTFHNFALLHVILFNIRYNFIIFGGNVYHDSLFEIACVNFFYLRHGFP